MSGIAKLGGTLGAALLAGLLIPGTTATPSAQTQTPADSHVHERRAADPAALVSEVPPAGHGRPDVAPHVSGGPAVGARHPPARLDAPDAAVAHRPQHRRVRRRSVAERHRDRDHRVVDRQRRAAGQSGRRAAAAQVHARSTNGCSASPTSSSQMEKGFKIPATGPDFTPGRSRRSEDDRRPLREVGADHPDRALLRPPLARLRRAAGGRQPRRPRASGRARTPPTRSI